MSTGSLVFDIVIVIWSIIYYIQSFLSYGTAYRMTKTHGDTGVSLFGWFIVFNLASIIPVLGIYLWRKYRHAGEVQESVRY